MVQKAVALDPVVNRGLLAGEQAKGIGKTREQDDSLTSSFAPELVADTCK